MNLNNLFESLNLNVLAFGTDNFPPIFCLLSSNVADSVHAAVGRSGAVKESTGNMPVTPSDSRKQKMD